MNNIRLRTNLIILVLLLLTQSDGLTQSKISGKVLQFGSKTPLENANVVLRGTALGSITNNQGEFSIKNVRPGRYNVEATFIGYEPHRIDGIVVSEGAEIILEFVLKVKLTSLKEVVVTPGYFSNTNSKLSLSKQDIEKTALFGGDIFRVVTRLPGVTGDDFSSKFNIRGGEHDEILVLFDGMELYDPFHQKDFGGVLSIIPVEATGSIDVLTGAFPAEFGRKKSGVFIVQPESESPEKRRSSAGLSFMNGRYMMEGPFSGDRGKWFLSARRGFVDVAFKISGDDQEMLPEYYDILGRLEYKLNDDHRLSANFLRAADKLNFVDTDDSEDANTTYGNTYAWLNLKSTFGEKLNSQLVLSVGSVNRGRTGNLTIRETEGIEVTDSSFTLLDDRKFNFAGINTNLQFQPASWILFKGGAEYKRISARYSYVGPRVDFELIDPDDFADSDIVLRQFEIIYVPFYKNVSNFLTPSGHEFAAHVSSRMRLTNFWTIEAGIRYDEQSYINGSTIGPRLNSALSLGENTVIKAGWGRFSQSQGIHELNVGDDDPNYYEAEESEHFILGAEHFFSSGINFKVEAYRKNLTDFRARFINVFNTIDVYQETSGDRIRHQPDEGFSQGIEFFLKKPFGQKYTWWASYVLAETQDTFDGFTAPKFFDQKHSIDLNFNYKASKRWHLNFSWLYHSGWPFTDGHLFDSAIYSTLHSQVIYPAATVKLEPYNLGRLPDYHRMDIRLTRNIDMKNGKLGIFLEFINAYDRKNIRNVEFGIEQAQITDKPKFIKTDHEFLRFLPSIGITWDR